MIGCSSFTRQPPRLLQFLLRGSSPDGCSCFCAAQLFCKCLQISATVYSFRQSFADFCNSLQLNGRVCSFLQLQISFPALADLFSGICRFVFRQLQILLIVFMMCVCFQTLRRCQCEKVHDPRSPSSMHPKKLETKFSKQ